MYDRKSFGPWLVAFAALLWAVDAPFRKYLTGELSSSTIVFMEHLVIAVLVIVFLARSLAELKNLNWKERFAVLFVAWGGSGLATIFFTQSFHYLNPSVAILLQKVQPFIAIFLASAVLKEKLTPKFWLWALLGVFGAYLVTFPELAVSGLSLQGGTLGVALALLAAFFWGGSTVFGRMVLRKVSFQAMTGARFLGALLFLFLVQIYYGRIAETASASARDWLYVLIVAVLAGFVSLFIYYRGLQATRASVATIAELVFPFSAVIINWIFLDARLEAGQIAGGLILLISLMQLTKVNFQAATAAPAALQGKAV
ncbi:MAG: DMT family transporter [Candidatus Doudnabacteria bacterium]|nr:DMT family transporter [Candidatus Doudnabacteria bacterium]